MVYHRCQIALLPSLIMPPFSDLSSSHLLSLMLARHSPSHQTLCFQSHFFIRCIASHRNRISTGYYEKKRLFVCYTNYIVYTSRYGPPYSLLVTCFFFPFLFFWFVRMFVHLHLLTFSFTFFPFLFTLITNFRFLFWFFFIYLVCLRPRQENHQVCG